MYPFTFTIYAAPTWRWLTFTESDGLASRVLDHQMRHELNKPKELTVILSNLDSGTRNYIDPTFNGWNDAASQPVAVGMEVRYDTIEMVPSSGSYGAVEETFYGVITELNQGPDQALIIKAKDFLERFEHITVSKTVFANYRDNISCDWALVNAPEAGSKLAIALPETTLVYPAVKVQFATDDEVWKPTPLESNTYKSLALGEAACQEFIAPKSGVYAFGYRFATPTGWTLTNGWVRVQILRDNGSDRPDYYKSLCLQEWQVMSTPTAGSENWTWAACDASVAVIQLDEGEKYWISIMNQNAVESGYSLRVMYDSAGPYLADHSSSHFLTRTSGGVYTSYAGNLEVDFWFVQFNDCPPDTYHYENISATGYLVLDKSPGQWTDLGIPALGVERGRVSYYYGTKQAHEVMDILIPLDYEYFKNAYNRIVDSTRDTLVPLYRTKGKTLGACLRELCDLIGLETPVQSAMACYRPHGTTYQQVKIGHRFDTTYAAEYTFGTGDFIENVNATMTSTNRPCRIVVIGKTTTDGTITATVEDDDWKAQCKFTITETIQDDSIQTVSAAFNRARAALEVYKRGIWEGTMRLAGIFPQLMHDHYLAGVAQWGDGAIIAVTWPDLGWSSLKLKVTGTTIGPDYTDVRFSNADALRNNIFINNIQSQQRSESFISPTDSQNILYLPLYTTAAGWSWGTYIDLCTAPTTPITNYKIVKGTSFDTTNPVRRVWHFEIDAKNGYTVDGTPINQLDFFTDYSKSVKIWTLDFASSLSASYNFYKWKTTKVIVDLVINPS